MQVKPLILFLSAASSSSVLYAVDPPSAGQLLREAERATPLPGLPRVSSPKIAPEVAAILETTGSKLLLKGVRFEGNTQIESSALEGVIKSYINQELTINDILLLADLLTEHYVRSGFLANVTVPKQDVSDGVVRFKIHEARFGGTRVNASNIKDVRVPASLLEQIVEHDNPKDGLITLSQIDRSLLLLSDLKGFSVKGGLQAGETVGESDLSLDLSADPFVSGSVSIDNHGGRSTGSNRLIASVALASPFYRGGELSFTALKNEGSLYARGLYSFPVGASGLSASVQGSAIAYDVITPEFATQKPRGESQTLGADMTYPFVRSYAKNVFVSAGLNLKQFKNESLSGGTYATQSDYNVWVGHAELKGNQLANSVSSDYSVKLSGGYADLSGSENYDDDQRSAKTHGRYAKLSSAITLTLPVASKLDLRLHGEGQLASKNLDSSEKFYLGGANGVRAYPESEAGGSEGLRVSADLGYQITDKLVGAVFVDWGRIRQYKDNINASGSSIADNNIYDLKGYGLSATYEGPKRSQVKATLSRRIGKNPNPTDDGTDQSGDLKSNRFWLSLLIPF